MHSILHPCAVICRQLIGLDMQVLAPVLECPVASLVVPLVWVVAVHSCRKNRPLVQPKASDVCANGRTPRSEGCAAIT